MTVKDLIEHLKTLPQGMEVWQTWDESGEYWPATKPLGRVDWVHEQTSKYLGTRWVESFTAQGMNDRTGKAVCVLLSVRDERTEK